jgi:hypothetical protein
MKKGKILARIWMFLGLVFIVWIWNSYEANGIDNATFESDGFVQVEITKEYISFTPNKAYQKVFIFYPGALVDPNAYAPLCRKIAVSGYNL